jgi:hypothetical protein
MAFSAEKHSVDRHVKTESFKTMHCDYRHRFGCPVREKSVMQYRQTGKVNISKRVRRSIAVTVTRMAVYARDSV